MHAACVAASPWRMGTAWAAPASPPVSASARVSPSPTVNRAARPSPRSRAVAQDQAVQRQLSSLDASAAPARQMAASILVRNKGKGKGAEVCLVTSRDGTGYVFPKGGMEEWDDSLADAALREAREEAGVSGSVSGVAWQGHYVQGRRRCQATVFVVDVNDVMKSWPEQHRRERKWVPLENAKRLAKHQWMATALDACALELGLQA